MTQINYERSIINIRKELTEYIETNNIQSLVLGLSGGIDSALAAALARPVCDKLDIPLIGRSLPITTNTEGEKNRAEEIGKVFCHNYDEIPGLHNIFHDLWTSHLDPETWATDEDENEHKTKIRKGNLKARLRMVYLYDLAQLHNGLVLSTDNLTEYFLGFWTLHGDVGDYGMFQNLWKTEVYGISQWIVDNELITDSDQLALSECIECQATDGLGISNTDLDQIMPGWTGTSRDGYAKVDKILQQYDLDEEKIDSPVIKRRIATEFKRTNPFNVKRSVLLAPEPIKYEKTQVLEEDKVKFQEKPWKFKEIEKFAGPMDIISMYFDSGAEMWRLAISRWRLETDLEFNNRVIGEKKKLPGRTEGLRYEHYKKLKIEFEK